MQYECEEAIVELLTAGEPPGPRRQGAHTVSHVFLWRHGSCVRELRYPQKARPPNWSDIDVPYIYNIFENIINPLTSYILILFGPPIFGYEIQLSMHFSLPWRCYYYYYYLVLTHRIKHDSRRDPQSLKKMLSWQSLLDTWSSIIVIIFIFIFLWQVYICCTVSINLSVNPLKMSSIPC